MGFLDYPRVRHDGERERECRDRPFGEPPARVYARVDRIEPEPDGGTRVLYDSVDADWFDESGMRGAEWLGSPSAGPEVGERISVVEEERPAEGSWDPEKYEGIWLELRFDRGGPEVQHYLNLFAAPLARTLSESAPLDAAKEAELVEKTSLEHLPDAGEDEIRETLAAAAGTAAAAVYDVGQGSSNALLRDGAPGLYFDVGGAALRDTRTFPAALTGFCATRRPPVVLSHWDWDHWSSAHRDPKLLELTWIVPRHDNRLGAVHAKFVGDLQAHGRVLVWPRELHSLSSEPVTVVQCTGSARNRNNSGLALIFGAHPEREGPRMLFPGDAGYRSVPGSDAEYTSIVVPHHGGRTPSGDIPPCDGSSTGRVVYSYGAGNSYWHPFADVGREHAATWKKNLHTAARSREGLGHVHLFWNEGEPAIRPPCWGSGCQLGCQQR